MARAFNLFHLSLIAPSEPSFFVENIAREAWLRQVLKEGFKFAHRKKDFFWVPKQTENGVIIGIVERQTPSPQHRPPNEGGGEIVGEIWQGAIVVIDPTHHADGQKLAFEIDNDVGVPSAVLGSLISHLNTTENKAYTIEAKPVFDASSFWDFSNEHGGRLRRITFDFVVPNMWDTKGRLEAELRGTGSETGSQKVKVSFESPDGVTTNSQRIEEGVEYSQQGGGSITARSLNNDHYSSTKRTSVSKIDEVPPDSADQMGFWRLLAERILGRG